MKLTDEDREALRASCCQCGDPECFVLLDTDWDGVNGMYAAVEQVVARHVAAALNAIAAEVEVAAEVRNFPKANDLTVGEHSGLLMAAHHLRTAARPAP